MVWLVFPCNRKAHGLLCVCITAELLLLRFTATHATLLRNVLAPLSSWLARETSQTGRAEGSSFVATKVNNIKDKRDPVSLTLKWQELLGAVTLQRSYTMPVSRNLDTKPSFLLWAFSELCALEALFREYLRRKHRAIKALQSRIALKTW